MKLLSGLLLPGLCLLLCLLVRDPAAAQSLSLEWATGCGSDDLNSA